MKLVVLIVSLFLVVYSCSRNSNEISKISQIPEQDRARIEKLLSFLIWEEGFAYVLFGNKPMSISSQDKTVPHSYLELYESPILELESLWRTWENYAHLFPMNDFIFLAENTEKRFNLYLLNKSNCLNAIEKNLAIFQEKIGLFLNPSEMLNYIIKSENLFKIGLNKSQALYGILLGYGTENAVGFENYFSRRNAHLPESLAHIETKSSSQLSIPCFASFSEEETQDLKFDYQKQREKILNIYSSQNFLEITINQLTMKNNHRI